MARRDLVGDDAEALSHHAAHELGREEPILGAHHELRGNGWPSIQWPRAVERRLRFGALLAECLLGKTTWYVVIERDGRVVASSQASVAAGLLVHGLSYNRRLTACVFCGHKLPTYDQVLFTDAAAGLTMAAAVCWPCAQPGGPLAAWAGLPLT